MSDFHWNEKFIVHYTKLKVELVMRCVIRRSSFSTIPDCKSPFDTLESLFLVQQAMSGFQNIYLFCNYCIVLLSCGSSNWSNSIKMFEVPKAFVKTQFISFRGNQIGVALLSFGFCPSPTHINKRHSFPILIIKSITIEV
jgi:hypothetical protein